MGFKTAKRTRACLRTSRACAAKKASVAHSACRVADAVGLVTAIAVRNAHVCLASRAEVSSVALRTSGVADAVGLVVCIAIRNARVCIAHQKTKALSSTRTWLASGSVISSVAHSTRRV